MTSPTVTRTVRLALLFRDRGRGLIANGVCCRSAELALIANARVFWTTSQMATEGGLVPMAVAVATEYSRSHSWKLPAAMLVMLGLQGLPAAKDTLLGRASTTWSTEPGPMLVMLTLTAILLSVLAPAAAVACRTPSLRVTSVCAA